MSSGKSLPWLTGVAAAACLGCNPPDHVVAFGPGTGAATGQAATTAATGASDGSVGTGDDGTEKLDVGDSGAGCGGFSDLEFSHIWIANSIVGTVSKIDTMTAVELGRYRTGPADPNPDPSRTAVNLHGDVAVINRHPNPVGVVKIAARPEDCVDRNDDGVVWTSTGADDVLPWGEDECVVWSSEAQDYFVDSDGGNIWGPRPAAWDGGVPDPDSSCPEGGGRLWVGWYDGTTDNRAHFQRLEGSTGAVLDTVTIAGWSDEPQIRATPYGAAATREGDLWVLGRYTELAWIDGMTLDTQVWRADAGMDFYSMALDADGQPWIAGWDGNIYRFDVDTETFALEASTGGRLRGIAIDFDGQAWVAANGSDGTGCWLVHYDTNASTLVRNDIQLPDCRRPVGVAIDAERFVWVVDNLADQAYKLDPASYVTVAVADGLVEPYTYSDMTGSGFKLVVGPG